ncbi:MAG: hypothetical protein ABIV25_11160 [Paracoccaceae bacterium]
MNPLPILALLGVAATYTVATQHLNDESDASAAQPPSSYSQAANTDLAVFDLVEHAAPSLDSPRCESQPAMAMILARDYDETPVEYRVVGEGLKVELWGSTEMGTWTLVHNGDDGIACVVSSGIGWTLNSTPDDVFKNAPLAS